MERLVKAVNVTIIFDSRKVQCEGKCGPDWSAGAILDIAKQRVAERFGKTVTLELLDLAVGNKSAAAWGKRVKSENLNLPMLVIDDEIRIPGEFDIRQMMDAIEVEQEINGT